MKINASTRLAAAERSLLNVIGLEGTLVALDANSGLYELKDNVEYVIQFLTKKFGQAKRGHRGNARLYVWSYKGLDFVLNEAASGELTLEICE